MSEWANEWLRPINQSTYTLNGTKERSLFTGICSWRGNASSCNRWWWTFPFMHAIKRRLCKTYVNAEHWHKCEGVKHKKKTKNARLKLIPSLLLLLFCCWLNNQHTLEFKAFYFSYSKTHSQLLFRLYSLKQRCPCWCLRKKKKNQQQQKL